MLDITIQLHNLVRLILQITTIIFHPMKIILLKEKKKLHKKI